MKLQELKENSRTAMEAWKQTLCAHDFSTTARRVCVECLADLFARLEKETQERRRLKAEVYALRAAAGEIVGVEPAGCPTPGACVAMRLQDRAAAIDEDNSWLRDENARLREALETNRHRDHHEGCKLRCDEEDCDKRAHVLGPGYECSDDHGPCDCGQAAIDAALAATEDSDAGRN